VFKNGDHRFLEAYEIGKIAPEQFKVLVEEIFVQNHLSSP